MKKVFGVVVIVALIFVVSGVVIVKNLNGEKINILIYGVDGKNNGKSERSDAIILANYNFARNELVLTSIPRDSYVMITCKNNKYDKINHAYAYGGEVCMNDTVKKLFGIKNVKNVFFDFEGVIDLVDYFGLIEVIPLHSFCQSDEYGAITYCFEKNKKIQMDGKQTLAYMRARKNLPNGDFDRIINQRQIFKIMINNFLKLSLIEKIKFYNYIKRSVKTDIELKDLNIKELINVQQIHLREYTLKGKDYINVYYYYKLDSKYLEKIKKYYI